MDAYVRVELVDADGKVLCREGGQLEASSTSASTFSLGSLEGKPEVALRALTDAAVALTVDAGVWLTGSEVQRAMRVAAKYEECADRPGYFRPRW